MVDLATRRDYKIYKVDRSGQMLGAPVVYPAGNDKIALGFAMRLKSGDEGICIWQAGRLVQEYGPGLQSDFPHGASREVRAGICQSETTEAFYTLVSHVPLDAGA